MKLQKYLTTFLRAGLLAASLFLITTKPVHAAECNPGDNVAVTRCSCPANARIVADKCLYEKGTSSGGLINPVLSPDLGQKPAAAAKGVTFVTYFVYLWRVIIFVGGIVVIIFYLQAGFDWINATGDQSKVSKAREKITNATIGLIILVGSFLLVSFIGTAIGYDLLNPQLPSPF